MEKSDIGTSGDETWVKLLSGVVRSGDYVRGHIDGRENFDKPIDHYSVASHSSFAARQSSSAFSTSSQDLLRCVTKGNIKWQQESGRVPVVYKGMPFVVCGRTEIRQCLHGPARKRHKADQAKQSGSSKSCNRLQPSL